MNNKDINANIDKFLSVMLQGKKRYINVDTIKALLLFKTTPVTQVSRAPEYVYGMIKYHGETIAVVDVSFLVNKSETQPTDDSVIIVMEEHIEGESMLLGMLVDSVDKIEELSAVSLSEKSIFEYINLPITDTNISDYTLH